MLENKIFLDTKQDTFNIMLPLVAIIICSDSPCIFQNFRNNWYRIYSTRHKARTSGFGAVTRFSFCDNHCLLFSFLLACKSNFLPPVMMLCKDERLAFLVKTAADGGILYSVLKRNYLRDPNSLIVSVSNSLKMFMNTLSFAPNFRSSIMNPSSIYTSKFFIHGWSSSRATQMGHNCYFKTFNNTAGM